MPITYPEEAFVSIINTDVKITALVPAARIYYNKVPENPIFPFINYQVSSSTKELVMNDTVSIAEKVYIVNSFSKNPNQIVAIAERIASRLHGYRGTIDGFKIERIMLENEIDDLYENDIAVYHTYQLYRVMYQEDDSFLIKD